MSGTAPTRGSNPAGLSISDILERQRLCGRESLIPVLQDLQDAEGYLSPHALADLSTAIGVSENEIYGVASFFTQFRFTPPARHTVRVCQGTACHVRGGRQVLHDFEERLKIKAGRQTPDHRIGLERVACIGCCALAPVVVVDDEVRAHMKPRHVRRLVGALAKEGNGGG